MAISLIILISITLAMYGIFGYVLKNISRKDQIIPTEAGPVEHVSVPPPYSAKPIFPKINGQSVDMSKYIRTVVCGNCMRPRHLNNGDVVLVKKINKDVDLLSQISKGKVLFLYVPERKLYKFRELDKIGEDGALYTKYYNLDGTEQSSSRTHSQAMVLGVAQYKL